MTAVTTSIDASSVSPLRAVLESFESGSATLTEVVQHTGLERDLVDAAVGHLVRTGRIVAGTLSSGCPASGCGSCASGVEGRPGCGAAEASPARTGPVLVTLSLAPPRR